MAYNFSNQATLIFIIAVHSISWAGDSGELLDPASQEALTKTQSMLNNAAEREKVISGDAKATWIDKQAKSVGGSAENTDAIYNLSSDILADLTRKAKGDPEKMKELLLKIQADPSSLEAELSPSERAKLRGIVERVPATVQQNAAPSPAQSGPALK